MSRLKFYLANLFDKPIWEELTFFLSVVALSSIASLSRLLSDSFGEEEKRITKIAIWTYLICGFVAGLIISLILHNSYGNSYFLVGLAGVAGFGSVQVLATLALLLNGMIKRIVK